jgi:hypothetical protein
MNTRIAHKLIWWVLPLLALRALVPAGFMIDTSEGDVSIIVCPGHALQSDSSDSNNSQGEHEPSTGQGATVCPFAVAAAAGPLSSIATFASAAAQPAAFIIEDIAGPKFPFGPSRAQQSRAPPFLS